MLSLLLVLSGFGRLALASLYSETPLLEITVPQKMETNTKDGKASETNVIYMVKIEGKTYTLLLEKQSFLYPHFMAYSYSKSGILQTDSSFVTGHCFYQGHIAEIPQSVVTLSTCSGLRGLLQLQNISYGIEPLETSATYEHMIYEIKNNKSDYSPSRKKDLNFQYGDQSYRILVKPEISPNVMLVNRMLKVQIIVDKVMYDYMGSDVGVIAQKLVHIFGLVNSMFSQLKMTIMLTSLEVWSDQNKISTDGDAEEVLHRFLSWKQKNSHQRSDDMTYLVLCKDHPQYVGATYHGMACNPKFSVGVALHPKVMTVEAFSVIAAQLLGVNLGLAYDDVHSCYCPGSTCIMNPEAVHSHGIKIFSSCSIDGFKHMVSLPEFKCLHSESVLEIVSQQQSSATCGNYILEEPEECDCGPPEKCIHKRCCNPADCTLRKNAECGTGACCDKRTCMIADRGRLCRKSKDMCDFPEFCNGNSEYCGPDTMSADLEPCNNRTAYCFGGICRDPDRQCKDIFGKHAKGSDYDCTEEVNLQNDKFGNCHGRCDSNFVLCGKMVCQWTSSEIIPISEHYDFQYTYLGGHVCVSAHLRTAGMADNTYVYNGTTCGRNKFCFRGECKHLNACNSAVKCQGHGVCNNFNNCHCDVGYAPPECYPTPSSPGGSYDDGFWNALDKGIPLVMKRKHANHFKRKLLYTLYGFLPFLIIIAITVTKFNMAKEFPYREKTVSGETVSEDSKNSNILS
uniref:ADAM metallopeptidase domain 3 n=1 Tax=Jaculus jaculus TaxID=51337 RepID=A0A8C5L1I9_JACJA